MIQVPQMRARRSPEGARPLSILPVGERTAEWDAFVERCPEGTFCHLAGWQRVIGDVFGHESLHRMAVDPAGRILGVMPLVRVRSRFFGNHLLSMPFLNNGGPIGTPEAQRALADAAVTLARGGRDDVLEFRARHDVSTDLTVDQYKVAVVMDLPETSSILWNDIFNSKFRNKIKRPQREGMVTKFGAEHLDAFYQVFAVNMRDLGSPVLPRGFFRRITEVFPGEAIVGATYWKGRPVAGGFGFLWGNQFEMTWSSALREVSSMKPNMLLYWNFMEHVIERGAGRFDFGRSTPGTGTHEFKLHWGGEDVPLPWRRWSARPRRAGSGKDGSMLRLATRVWKRFPVAVANFVGPTMAAGLPWW